MEVMGMVVEVMGMVAVPWWVALKNFRNYQKIEAIRNMNHKPETKPWRQVFLSPEVECGGCYRPHKRRNHSACNDVFEQQVQMQLHISNLPL